MYCQLGARMAFLGIDARTERTRHQVNYPETYDQIFARLTAEFKAAAAVGQPIKHLILLLGVPIAYPVCFSPLEADCSLPVFPADTRASA